MGMRAPFFKSIELSYIRADILSHMYVGKWRSYNTYDIYHFVNKRTTALGNVSTRLHDKFLDMFRDNVKIRYVDD